MSQGQSGRMVVEIEPRLKRELYAELARDGLTFKDWLVATAERYILERAQRPLFADDHAGQAVQQPRKPR